MENKLTHKIDITCPEGYVVDEENSSFKEIVFKKKINNKPKSFKELGYIDGYYYGVDCIICVANDGSADPYNANIWPTKELAEASLALCQLLQLRKTWIGDWEPDYKDAETHKFVIHLYNDVLTRDNYCNIQRPLSFPTVDMRNEFMETFNDLLVVAKPLL